MIWPLICGALALGAAAPPPSPQEGVADSSDGVPIHFRVLGKGSPALVFIHCWGCDQHLWDAQLPRFGRSHRVVTLDLAGHGASGRGRQDYTIQGFGQDVQAVVEKLDLESVVLVGHSMGGPVALEAARRLGRDVVGIVPVDTLLDVDRPNDPKETEAALGSMQADFKGASASFVRKFMFVSSTDPQLIEQIVKKLSSFPPDIGISSLRNTWAYDAGAALETIRVPIHAVNADKFPTNLAAARRHAPQFEATIMKGVGHYLMLEDPPRFGELLDSVLRAMASGKPGP